MGTPKAPKGKKGGSGSQSPCPVSVVLKDINAKKKLREYSSDKEVIKCFDTSQVTTMEYPFMKKFVNADISSWDVSSVTAMGDMFYDAKKFNGDVSDWDVSSVENMFGMFADATVFNSDVSDWDVSSVIDMAYMFGNAIEFNGDVSDWDVCSLRLSGLYGMFDGATKYTGDVLTSCS